MKSDWQLGHTEPDGKNGRKSVVYDFNDGDDQSAISITIRGRNNESFALKLAQLLNDEGVSSHQI